MIFGITTWCQCKEHGNPHPFTTYTGKRDNSAGPLGSHVVNKKVPVVAKHSDPFMDEIFLCNLFTSFNQLANLAETYVKVTGTVRENITFGACNKMKPLKEMKKSDKGTFNFQVDGIVYFFKWNDDLIINVGRNFFVSFTN